MKKSKKPKTISVESAEYPLDMQKAVDKFRATYLVKALWMHLGNVSNTAISLKVTRRTVQLCMVDARINAAKIRKESKALLEEGITELEDPLRYIKRGKR